MKPILINAFNQGGVADSKYSGIKNSNARLIGWDIHSEPGLLKVNQKMTKISGSTVTELCKVVVACSNNIRYWFSATSGKIWQEKAGVFTLVLTLGNLTGITAGVSALAAAEYQGYLYWATQNFIGRIPLATADGVSNWGSYADRYWAELNLDQTIGGTGNTYTAPVAISETATNRQTFVANKTPLESIKMQTGAKGTGDWTMTVHDSSNNIIATKTIVNGTMLTGINIFQPSATSVLTPGNSYHVHFTSTVADGTVVTSVAADLEGALLSIYTTSDASYHPMQEVNLVLYVGDKNLVHQVDSGIFTQAALDIESQYRVSALGKMGTDLLVGTIIASSVSKCEIFRWNTWSVSFTNSDTVYEPGINSFLQADNYIIINAGLAGNLYSYNGQSLEFYKKIPGTYTPTAQAIIYPYATDLFNGFLPIFGVSNVQGDPCNQGIWSLGRHSRNYPTVLNLDFLTSNVDGNNYNILSGLVIGAIVVVGQDIYMSWSYNNTYGIDQLDYSNKIIHPILETRVMSPLLGGFTTFTEFIATYEASLPANTSIAFKYGKNGLAADTGTDIIAINDSDRVQVKADGSRLDARTLQLRMEATASGNNAPEIQELIINIE